MFPSPHAHSFSVYSKVPQSSFVAEVKPACHKAQLSLKTGPLSDRFERGQSPIRFGSASAPRGFGGGDDPNDPSRWLLADSHYSESQEETLPNPYLWNSTYGSFEPEHHEDWELAGFDMSTPKIDNDVDTSRKTQKRKGMTLQDMTVGTLRNKAKKAKDKGNLEEAEYLYELACQKASSTSGGAKRHRSRPSASELVLSDRTLREKARVAREADDLAEAARLYTLALEKRHGKPDGPKDYAKTNAPESELAGRTLRRRALAAQKQDDLATSDRLYELAREKEASKYDGPYRIATRPGAPTEDLAARTLQSHAKAAKSRGDMDEANRLYAIANAKRKSRRSQQQAEPVRPKSSRSIFSPKLEVRSHLSVHLKSISEATSSSWSQSMGTQHPSHARNQDAAPPNAGHQPLINSTEEIGWQQARGDADLWRYHYGDGKYSDWNTKSFWDNQKRT